MVKFVPCLLNLSLRRLPKNVMLKYSSVTCLEKRYCHRSITILLCALKRFDFESTDFTINQLLHLLTMRKWKLLGGKEIKTT